MFGPDIEQYRKLVQKRMEWPDLSPEEKTRMMHEMHLPRFWNLAEYLADEARKMALEVSMSWRGFKVGCGLYAFKARPYYPEDFYRVFRGSNIKPYPEGPAICAEAVAALAARHEGYDLIVGIVIAGVPQEDHASGLVTPTLEPCGKCRILLEAMPEVREDTAVLTVHLDTDIREAQTFRNVLEKHRSCER